ncbi:hypothetical protein CIPAW_01G187200 [Carya illinoinensis]|uniref:Fe2OG dioxygenase domain-containing protein n=1 Tax=Carya illinoinensis TaxID=32201 RepID=A0A8T1RRJ2_CARIL|nr:hypothetical protein CIPAW_01G187200 [Carya illinoinensis]KAG6732624.1 hypothetical protein I3842_01G186800 [Carya illinoinensis]
MTSTGGGEPLTENFIKYDRLEELKEFDESKAGVKGLVDAGIARIPRIFVRPPEELASDHPNSGDPTNTQFTIPVIDLGDTMGRRAEVRASVQRAAETAGFFQVVNHGIAKRVLEEMLEATRRFHELPTEVKAEYYTRDQAKKVLFESNFDLYQSKFANWRDNVFCVMDPEPPEPEEFPPVCRDITIEYAKQVRKLGITLFELLSEALGLTTDHLLELDCAKGQAFLLHYYPACPEPQLTMGTSKHSDPDYLTILLQDHVGGLQILHQDRWIDVHPLPGALVINIGDLLQLLSNDRFKSVEHRVLANSVEPRVSIACFFTPKHYPSRIINGPIKELLSEDNPPVFRETSVQELIASFYDKGIGGNSTPRAIARFKLQQSTEY